MTTVFLSGSRSISRTNDAIRKQLDNLIARRLYIIPGDANGADRAMQSYFAAPCHYLEYQGRELPVEGKTQGRIVGTCPGNEAGTAAGD